MCLWLFVVFLGVLFFGCVEEEGFCDFAVKNSFSSSLVVFVFVFAFGARGLVMV